MSFGGALVLVLIGGWIVAYALDNVADAVDRLSDAIRAVGRGDEP